MNALIHIPDNDLKEAIDCIWYQNEEHWEYTSVCIPFLQQEIIINFGQHFSVQTATTRFNYTKVGGVSGIFQQPLTTKVAGKYNAIGIMLKPHGLHSLLGVNAAGLNVPQTLQYLLGDTILQVAVQIEQTPAPADKIKLLQSFLLSAARPAKIDATIHDFVQIISHQTLQKGNIKAYLANKHFAHKKFIARFSAAFGLTPQKYLQLQQLNNAVAQIAAKPNTPLIHIAIDNGFYDHAHFIHTFKAYTHITPTAYKKAVLAGKVQLSFPNAINV